MLPRIMHPNMALVRREFETGDPLTFHDLEARVGIDARNCREYLKILHGIEEIRIGRWRRDSPQGPWVAVYLWGPGEDAIKPSAVLAKVRRRLARRSLKVKELESESKKARRKKKMKVLETPSIVNLLLGV